MKKSSIISFFMLIISIFIFSACAKKPSYSGEFTQETFVLSLNEEVDFFDELKLKGINQEDVQLSISNNLAEQTENGFKMIVSGEGLLTASKDNKVFASANVIVKQAFASPTNLTISDSGEISWQPVYVIFKGELITANSYRVEINNQEFQTSSNTYQIENGKFGVYSVRVKVEGQEYVDESEYSQLTQLNYGVMGLPFNVNVDTGVGLSSNSLTLSWDSNAVNASFDVVVAGIIIARDLTSRQVTLDFSNFNGGRDVEVSIITKDNSDIYYPSSYDFVISKHFQPNVSYVYENGNGFVRWSRLDGATGYVVRYLDVNNGINYGMLDSEKFFERGDYVYSSLDNLAYGIYNLQIQAKGGKTGDKFYADSEITELSGVAKLKAVEIDYRFDKDNLHINIPADNYAKNYELIVEAGQTQKTFAINSTGDYIIPLKDLPYGELNLSLQAKPSLTEDNLVLEIEIGSQTTDKVVSSDKSTSKVYRLQEIGEITHALSGNNGILTFDKVEFADNYVLTLNGQVVDSALLRENGDKLDFIVPALVLIAPNGLDYDFEITAFRNDNASNQVKGSKRIAVLSTPEKANAENGYFAWSSLGAKDIEYDYVVYKSDAEGSKGEIVQSETTTGLQTLTKLDFGYYIIQVYAKSLNTNEYLDANFGGFVENNFLEEYFYVTKQIESPTLDLIFDETQGKYVLEMSNQDYAGSYEVYLNNFDNPIAVIEPTDFTKEKFTYTFTSTNFDDNNGAEKRYNIQVIAKAGERSDKVIHTPSTASQLEIVRLAQPTFAVSEDELLTVVKPTGAKTFEIVENGKVVNDVNDVEFDLSSLTGAHEYIFRFVASERNENTIYLDSRDKNYSIRRLDTPSELAFENGNLTYKNPSHANVQRYDIEITLVNANNGNRVYNTTCTELDFALNDFVASKRSDPVFVSAYDQCSEVQVKVRAYRNSFSGEVFYLKSPYSSAITLSKLASPVISFNRTDLTLSWGDGVGDVGRTTYSIYIDGQRYLSLTGHIHSFADYDFTAEKEIVVYADNPAYLASASSNAIKVRKLEAVSTFVYKEGQEFVTATLPNLDLNVIDQVIVNGTDISKASLTNGSFANLATGEIKLVFADFKNADKYEWTIQLIAKEKLTTGEVDSYYINSEARKFTFYNLSEQTVTFTNDGENLAWTDLGGEFKGQSGNPLTYDFVIKNSDHVVLETSDDYKNLTETSIALSDPRIFGLNANSYIFEVKTNLVGYSITATDDGAVGYFGSKSFGEISIKKLEAMPEYNYQIVEAKTGNIIDKQLNGDLKIVWKDVWGSPSTIYFSLDIDAEFDLGSDFLNNQAKKFLEDLKALKDGSSKSLLGYSYSLKLVNGYYELVISGSIVKMVFGSGTTSVPVTVYADKQIDSDIVDVKISRLYNVADSAELGGNGEITIPPVANATHYYMLLSMGGQTQEIEAQKTQSGNTIFDLMTDYISNKTGNYTIQIIAVDKSENSTNRLPSYSATTISGYRLQGVSEIRIDGTGLITFVLSEGDKGYFEDLQFVLNYKGVEKEFVPECVEEGEIYTFNTNEVLSLFDEQKQVGIMEFKVMTKRSGCVNSLEKEFKFGYALENAETLTNKREIDFVYDEIEGYKTFTNKLKDYLVIFNDVENTTGLWIELHSTALPDVEEGDGEESENPDEIEDENVEKVIKLPIDANSIKGYWVTQTIEDGEGNVVGTREYFSTIKPSEALGLSAKACFALCVNDVLSPYADGEYTFYVSKIIEKDGVVTNYGNSTLVYNKLPAVKDNSLRTTNEILSWVGIDSENVSGYYLSVYTINDNEYQLYKRIEINTATTYDLTQIIETFGTTYYFEISTISENDRYVASSPTQMISTSRYVTPEKLEIKDGVVQYSEQAIASSQFLKDIENNISNYNVMAQVLATSTYTYPFEFMASNIDRAYVQLRFTAKDNQQNIYYVTIPAVQLLAGVMQTMSFTSGSGRITYFDALRNCRNTVAATTYGPLIDNLYRSITSSSFGFANSQRLFDDFGNLIPAGQYYLTLRQQGTNIETINHQCRLPSVYSENILMYVSESPSIRLDRDNETTKNVYFVSFRPVQIASATGEKYYATNYKLHIVDNSQNIFEYSIKQEGEDWRLYISEEESFLLGKRTYAQEEYISIDVTNELVKRLEPLKGQRLTVSIYAEGNNFTANSKSDTIFMTMLNFNYESLNLVDGVLSWSSSASSNGTLVTYKTASSSPSQITIRPSGTSTLNLANPGAYTYVMFMALGGLSSTEMVVDSESYMLENVYKRPNPVVAIANGRFLLSGSASEGTTNYVNYSQFNVTNNLSTSQHATTDKLPAGTTIEYIPGAYANYQENTADFNVRRNELSATNFYFSSSGNTIVPLDGRNHFVKTVAETNNEGADFVLQIAETSQENEISYCVLASSQVSVKAKMLDAVVRSRAKIQDGNIVWEANSNQLEDGVIVYQVIVQHYGENDESVKQTDIFYTTGTTLPSNLINSRSDASLYSVAITTFAGREFILNPGESMPSGVIETLDNKLIIPTQIVYAGSEDNYALVSAQTLLANKRISKFNMPESASIVQDDESATISEQIVIRYNSHIDSSSNITFRVLDAGGKLIDGEIDKNYVYGTSTTGESYTNITFNINKNALEYGRSYQFVVYAYTSGEQNFYDNITNYTIMSDGVKVTTVDGREATVYKLKQVSQDEFDFDYDVLSGRYNLSFEKYFDNYKGSVTPNSLKIKINYQDQFNNKNTVYVFASQQTIMGDNDFVANLRIAVTDNPEAAGSIIESKDENGVVTEKVFYIARNTTLTIQAVVNGNSGIGLNSVTKLFPSVEQEVKFTSSSFAKDDKVEWNPEQRFLTWTCSKYVLLNNTQTYVIKQEGESYTIQTSLTLAKDSVVELLDEEFEIDGTTYVKINLKDENDNYVYIAKGSYKQEDDVEGKEFLVYIEYADVDSQGNQITETSGIITATSASELFYQPVTMGTITKISVYVRGGKTALFSTPITITGNFEFDIFAGGNGTQENPYLIATGEQFKNISLRNQENHQYYFALKNDIEVDITDEDANMLIAGIFYGYLDGKNYTINLNVSKKLDASVSATLATKVNITLPISSNNRTDSPDFTRGISMFERVASSATIKNFNLNVSWNVTNIENGNTLFAPIAMLNYGRIENINIANISTNFIMGNDTNRYIALSGLVGDNYGYIENCTNSADVNMSVDNANPSSSNVPYLVYSGIAIRHANPNSSAGTIRNCFTTGNVTLIAKKNNSRLYASGIAINVLSQGVIANCGNDGNITITAIGATNYVNFASGIALRSSRGRLQNCYNNGKISAGEAGGIAYSIIDGSVQNIVETSGLPFASACTATGSEVYAQTTKDGLSIVPNALSVKTLSPISGKYLHIVNDNGFKAYIDENL